MALGLSFPVYRMELIISKKAFLSEQCKEIEENNRMGKTRELLKKIRDIKETFLGSKITADADCSHEIKRRLLLGAKAKTIPSCGCDW